MSRPCRGKPVRLLLWRVPAESCMLWRRSAQRGSTVNCRHAIIAIGFTVTAVSCAKPPADAPVAGAGDTVRVSANGDGKWGAPFEAVEVLRVPGDREETTFGSPRNIVARPDGGVLVYDEKGANGAILHSFDANGRFERSIGGEGNGPGEFSGSAIRFVVHRDGTILFLVARRAIHRFAPDGRLLRSFGIIDGSQPDIVPGDDGTFYTTARLQPIELGSLDSIAMHQSRSASLPRQHMPVFHYDTAGRIIDSLVFRGAWLDSEEPPYSRAPSQRWEPLPDGRILVTRSDRLGIVIVDPLNAKPPLLSEIPTHPVPMLAEERVQQQASENASSKFTEGGRTIVLNEPARVSEFKLAAPYSHTDTEGRIWITKAMPSEKVERYCNSFQSVHRNEPSRCVGYSSYRDRPAYVGFDTDGTFLGEVRFPMFSGSVAFTGDFAWIMTRTTDGEPVLTKYRVRRKD